MKRLIATFLLVAAAGTMLAHDGHGAFEGHTVQHYVGSWEHFLPILIALAAGISWMVWQERATRIK